MLSEHQIIKMRVKTALVDQEHWRVTLTLELDNATPRDIALCERQIVEGGTVDLMVSGRFGSIGQVKEAERSGE